MEQQENRVVLVRGTVAEEATFSHSSARHCLLPLSPGSALPVRPRGPAEHPLPPHPPQRIPCPSRGLVEVRGEVRSFNNRSGVGNRLVITVLARELLPSAEEPCNQGS